MSSILTVMLEEYYKTGKISDLFTDIKVTWEDFLTILRTSNLALLDRITILEAKVAELERKVGTVK